MELTKTHRRQEDKPVEVIRGNIVYATPREDDTEGAKVVLINGESLYVSESFETVQGILTNGERGSF